LWKELGLYVYENNVLRKIYRPKRDEIRGELRILHNVYSLHSIVRVHTSKTEHISFWAKT
jgi:hypothetical protein